MKKVILLLSSIIIFNGAFPFMSLANNIPGNSTNLANRTKLRHLIQIILKDPRFGYQQQPAWLKWLSEKLVFLFQHKPKSSAIIPHFKIVDSILKYSSIILVITLPFILLYLSMRFFEPNLNRRKRAELKNKSRATSALDLMQNADLAATAGNLPEAIRGLYLAVLEKFREENILSGITKTSDKENLKVLKKHLGVNSPEYHAFSHLVQIFQEKWYGLKGCLPQDYLTAKKDLDLLWSNIGKLHEEN